MTRLSIVTITCRSEPLLPQMAASLAVSAQRAGVYLQWLVVDERAALARDLDAIGSVAGARVRLEHVDAPLSPHRADTVNLRPAHATARNFALTRVTGDYVVWLDDCTMLTADAVAVALEIARRGAGWRCKQMAVRSLQVQDDRPLTLGARADMLRPVPPSVVGGSCWGHPLDTLLQVGGFDEAYNGLEHGHDHDAALRMARVGLSYCTTQRAVAVKITKSARRDEVTSAPTRTCQGHVHLLAQLARDTARTLPLAPGADGASLRGPVESHAPRQAESAATPRAHAPCAARCEDDAAAAAATDALELQAAVAVTEATVEAPTVAPIEVVVYESHDHAGPAPLEIADVGTNGTSSKRRRKRRR